MEDAYQDTMRKKETLAPDFERYIIVWGHEIRARLKDDKEMREYFKNYKAVDHIRPRDFFYGGHTEGYCMR